MCENIEQIFENLKKTYKVPFKGTIIDSCTFHIGELINEKNEKEYYIVSEDLKQLDPLNSLAQGQSLISYFKNGK